MTVQTDRRGAIRWDAIGVLGVLIAIVALGFTVLSEISELKAEVRAAKKDLGGQIIVASAEIQPNQVLGSAPRLYAYLFVPTQSRDPRVLVTVNRAGRFEGEYDDGRPIPSAFNVEAHVNAASHSRLGDGVVVTVYLHAQPDRSGLLNVVILQGGADVNGPVVAHVLTENEYDSLTHHFGKSAES